MDEKIFQLLKREKRKRRWHRVLSVMMCAVVFWTTYALILPAITKEAEAFCGIEEHVHEEGCFEQVLSCLSHEHDENCYETSAVLVCTEAAEPEHIHSDACAPVVHTELTCSIEETEGHVHSDSCNPVEYTELRNLPSMNMQIRAILRR